MLVVVACTSRSFLDRWYAGQNEHTIGNEGSKMAFFTQISRGVSEPNFLTFSGKFTMGLNVGVFFKSKRKKEIELERERPDFPKTRRASAAFW